MINFFKYGNGRIHYTDQGTGEAIILLHGYLVSGETWKSFAQKLSTGFRVITVDLPGHGLSDVYGEIHSMEFLATSLKSLLSSLDIKKAFITGHSLGGYVTLAFLELYPETLSGYCLFHSQPFADVQETIEKRKQEIHLAESGRKDQIYPVNIAKMFAAENLEKFREALRDSMEIASKIPGKGITALLRGMMERPSRSAFMEEGRVPCLWILGEKDNYIDCEAIQKRVRLPVNAKVVVLKNSGHLGFIEEEELSLNILRSFVEGLF